MAGDNEVEVLITGDSSGAEAAMSRASGAVGSGAEEMREHFEGIGDALEGIKAQFKTAFEVTGIALAVEGLKKLTEEINHVSENAVHLEHLSAMLSVSTTELQGLHAAAAEAGIASQTFDNSLMLLSLRMQQARDGSSKMQEKLAAVGISIADLRDPTFTAVDAAYALSESHASAGEKLDVVGRRGIALLQVLEQLKGGHQGAIDKARELGAATDAQIQTLAAAHARIADVSTAWDNFKTRIASGVAPALADLLTQLTRLFDIVGAGNAKTAEFDQTMRNVEKEVLGWAAAMRELWIQISGTFEYMGTHLGALAAAANAALHGRFDEARDIWNQGDADLLAIDKRTADALIANREGLAKALNNVDLSVLQDVKPTAKAIPTGQNAVQSGDWKKELFEGLPDTSQLTDQMDLERRMSDQGTKAKEALEKKFASIHPQLDLKQSEKQMKDLIKDWDDTARAISEVIKPIGRAFEQSITGMLNHTQTFRQGLSKIWNSIVQEFVQLCVQMAERWAVKELTQVAMSQSSGAIRMALAKAGLISESEVTTTTITEKKAEAAATIPAEAAMAAGGAAASVASIPYVGPFLAAAAYADTMALVMSGLATAAAAGGFDIPAGVNPVTQLHAREMVLPASIAETFRNAAPGGGPKSNQSTHNWNIGAIDGASVARLIRSPAFRRNLQTSFGGHGI